MDEIRPPNENNFNFTANNNVSALSSQMNQNISPKKRKLEKIDEINNKLSENNENIVKNNEKEVENSQITNQNDESNTKKRKFSSEDNNINNNLNNNLNNENKEIKKKILWVDPKSPYFIQFVFF